MINVRSSNGRLKAYSYDGVSPNLPVPFRASFRRRKGKRHEDDVEAAELEDLPPSVSRQCSGEDIEERMVKWNFLSYFFSKINYRTNGWKVRKI